MKIKPKRYNQDFQKAESGRPSIGTVLSKFADKSFHSYISGDPFQSDKKPSTPCDYIQKVVSALDAVVIRTVRDKSSQLTATGEFVFTDYNVTVDEVL